MFSSAAIGAVSHARVLLEYLVPSFTSASYSLTKNLTLTETGADPLQIDLAGLFDAETGMPIRLIVIQVSQEIVWKKLFLEHCWMLITSLQVFCAYLAYVFGKFACKVSIQREAFALPIYLAQPLTLIGVTAMCSGRNSDPCAYKSEYLYTNYYQNNRSGHQPGHHLTYNSLLRCYRALRLLRVPCGTRRIQRHRKRVWLGLDLLDRLHSLDLEVPNMLLHLTHVG